MLIKLAYRSRGADARKVIDYLFTKPIIDASKVAEIIDKTPSSAYKLISSLANANILKESTGTKRGRLYMFEEYVHLFKTDPSF